MSSISSNSFINKKRQSNARKTAAVVARHRQSAFQIHRDSLAQTRSSAHSLSSRIMLQDRDINMSVTSKRRRRRSSEASTQSMSSSVKQRKIASTQLMSSSAKQRKTAQQMKFARQNNKDHSDIHKLQNQ